MTMTGRRGSGARPRLAELAHASEYGVNNEGSEVMKKVFVTGGSGFVGRNLIRRLRADGVAVAALARSEQSANQVAALGATPVRGDLLDTASLQAGMAGCQLVFHSAAFVEEWGPRQRYWDINVVGTQMALDAARAAGVEGFVHVSTEAIYADGRTSMENLDETRPVPKHPLPRYPATKAEAERRVLAASRDGFRCVSVRPRLIWGNDDTSVLPKLIEAVQAGRFVWADHGRALTSTTHVDNVCEGLILAAQKGRGGEAYFISDGDPISSREFLSALMATRGVIAPEKSVPMWLAGAFAAMAEGLWEVLPLKSAPPATRMVVALGARSVTVSINKAASELGYRPIVSRDDALLKLARSSR